jgi:predicted glutamine amidotransferase
MELKREADRFNTNIVIHFRIATSGGVNYENCHPFKVNEDIFFCHNGILDIEVPIYSKINDTQIYNNTFLKGLPSNFVQNDSLMQLIEFSIGANNKFVFLDSYGDFYIINENAGNWHKGAWYSNKSYMSACTYYAKPYSSKSINEYDEDEEVELPCECCGEIVELEKIQYDDFYDIYLCENCHKYESYQYAVK